MASGDTIIITIKTPLLLLQQTPRCQGARVCLRTSGNRTPKCKHGSEVPIAPGLDPERGVRFYNSPWGAPMNRDLKGPSVLSPSTLTPNPVRPWHLTVQGRTAPGTPLYRGPEEDACPVSGARWARRGLGTGPRRAWERHPRRGGHWGKVPPARGPHTGRGTASPGGQRPRSAASRPARGRSYGPGHPHHHHHPHPHAPRRALGPRRWAPFWQGVPSPSRGSPPTPGPPDSPSPGYRWPAAPSSSAATATSSGAVAAPRPAPAPMAAGARGPGGSERAAPARGGHAPRRPPERRWGTRVLLFHAGAPPAAAPPGRALETAPAGARGLGLYKSGGAAAEAAPTPDRRGPGPVLRSPGPEPFATPRPPGFRPGALWATICAR